MRKPGSTRTCSLEEAGLKLPCNQLPFPGGLCSLGTEARDPDECRDLAFWTGQDGTSRFRDLGVSTGTTCDVSKGRTSRMSTTELQFNKPSYTKNRQLSFWARVFPPLPALIAAERPRKKEQSGTSVFESRRENDREGFQMRNLSLTRKAVPA